MRLVLSLVVCVFAAAQDLSSRADEYVQSWVRDGLFRGSVLVAKDGEVLFRKGYGMANEEWANPNAPDTRFRLGSITKQFTAAAILQLVEQNKLQVTDPISKYYSEAPAAWEKVTIHHLLNHTSGIPSYTSMPDFFPKMSRDRRTPAEIVKLTQDKPLEFEPGTKHVYDNTGYILLGYVIEKVSGMPYADYLDKNVFPKAGMKDSGYDLAEKIIPHRASGYTPDGKNTAFLDMSLPYAAGSLYSTVDDLLKWDQALYAGKIVNAESLAKMTTPGLNNYGYGLVIDSPNGRKRIGHGGGINGFNTSMVHFPDQGVVTIALANQNTQAVGPITENLAKLAFGETIQPRPLKTEIKLPASKMDDLAGEYELRPGFILKMWRDGEKFMTQATNQGPVQAFPASENKFFLKVVDAELEFERGADGRAVAVTLHQGGRDMKAPRKQ